MTPKEAASLKARLMALSVSDPNSGCWLWIGNARAGGKEKLLRPRIKINRKYFRAYRISYEVFVGPITAGSMVCHKCNVPLCINPNHLYLGDTRSNYLDCVQAGRIKNVNGRFTSTMSVL